MAHYYYHFGWLKWAILGFLQLPDRVLATKPQLAG